MVRRYLLPLTVLILSFSMLPAGVLAGGPASTCYPPLSLVTTSIPSATAGSSYTVALAGNGGQPPYFWSFGRSSLPKGFSINANGQVTGTPTSAGSYTFNVVLSDSLKDNVTGALTLTVAAAPPPPPTTPPPTTPPPTTPPPTTPHPQRPNNAAANNAAANNAAANNATANDATTNDATTNNAATNNATTNNAAANDAATNNAAANNATTNNAAANDATTNNAATDR